MIFIILLLILLLFIIFGFKNSISNYIKVFRTYRSIPCPPNRLPLLGNLFDLPLDPYRKISISEGNLQIFLFRIFTKT
jgi:hypothetical protein